MAPVPRHTPQEQESMVLDAAAKCIEEASLLDFTMSSLAKEAGMSMGSIYKHVQSKQDVLVALASRSMAHLHNMTETIWSLPLTTPEKLIAGTLITPQKFHLYSFGVHLEMLIGNAAVIKKASSHWLARLARFDQSMETIYIDAISSACDEGELDAKKVGKAELIEELMIGFWSMHVGFVQVAYQRDTQQLGSIDTIPLPFPLATDHELVVVGKRLLNSYSWETPLCDKGIEKTSQLLVEHGFR